MARSIASLSLAAAAVLFIVHVAECQLQNPTWEQTPNTQAYTIYNGQIFPHVPQDNSWYTWLGYDRWLTPVVESVGKWIPSMPSFSMPSFLGGSGGVNGTNDDLLDSQSSQMNAQYASLYPNSNGFNKNSIPQYGADKFPQQQQQQPGLNFGRPVPYNPRFPPPPSQQQPNGPQTFTRPQEQQQFLLQKQQQSQQLYGAPQQQPYLGSPSSFGYGNPGVELANHVEGFGTLDGLVAKSQERHYQPSSPSFSPKNSFDVMEPEKSPQQQQSEQPEASTEVVKANAQESSSSSADEKDGDEPFPCPTLAGPWKFDGQYCIAIGPYPTWGCKPNDLVMSARIAICRNKIFFPSEP